MQTEAIRQRLGWNVPTLSLCCLAVLLAFGCQQRNEYVAPPPPAVTVARPIERSVQEYFETTGTTAAVAKVELRARVGGYLQQMLFKDGDMVEEGTLLFVIDKATYQAAFASAEANLAKAKSQFLLAEQQLARTLELAKNDAATKNALDVQRAEQSSKKADVDAAEAALRDAELNLAYTEIRAPFSGRVGRHLVDPGNLVVAGETMLASVETVDPIHTYFTLSEAELLRFMEMQRQGTLKFNEADPPVISLSLSDTGKFNFHGRLDFREFGIDPGTGTTQRRAVFPNPDGALVPGLFVRIRSAIGEPRSRLLVDERAIGADQRGDYLLVVNDKNVVETRLVKLGQLQDGLRVIENGLQKDDRVVVNGLQRARPGAEVAPEESAMDASVPEQKASPEESAVQIRSESTGV